MERFIGTDPHGGQADKIPIIDKYHNGSRRERPGSVQPDHLTLIIPGAPKPGAKIIDGGVAT